MSRKLLKVATPSGENLRGRIAAVRDGGVLRRVEIVTHIRNDRWLVEGREFYNWRERSVVPRAELIFVKAKP